MSAPNQFSKVMLPAVPALSHTLRIKSLPDTAVLPSMLSTTIRSPALSELAVIVSLSIIGIVQLPFAIDPKPY